jgi:thiamine-phosphate pyrophosphorylase
MEKMPEKFGFYAILTNPMRGYEYVTQILVEYKIAFVQLRMKDAELSSIEDIACKMRKITLGTSTRLIINDYPDIAKKINADGVHIGQTDMQYSDARKIMGDSAIIGLSTHSPFQTKAACELSPDYIGIGPVFPTPTKKNPDPVIGISTMKEMLSISSVPGVAIGGITLEKLPEVLAAGAQNFSMVRPVNASDDPEKVIKEILRIYAEKKS